MARGLKTIPDSEAVKSTEKTVANVVDRFVRTGSVQPGVGGNRLRTARTDDVVLYTEFCKRQRPSMYASEIQKQLIDSETQRLVQNVILKLEKINIVLVKPVMVKHP